MKKLTFLLLILSLMVGGTVVGCGEKHQTPPTYVPPETPDDEEDEEEPEPDPEEGEYPTGLTVTAFEKALGADECNGFYATVDFAANPKLAFRPVHSAAKKPTAYFAAYTDGTPYITTNGGFFGGVTSVSLLIDDGRVRANNATEDNTDDMAYPIARAVLGQMDNGQFEAVWEAAIGGVQYAFDSPVDNDDVAKTKGTAKTATDAGARKWAPKYAIGGGPMLVYEGKNVAAANAKKEVLSYIAGRNPRTALGVKADGKLIVLVCDGRGKNGSVGFTFVELADYMIELGCQYVVNLDGGGSSVFIGADGKAMNAPSDGAERNVPTAVVIAQTK